MESKDKSTEWPDCLTYKLLLECYLKPDTTKTTTVTAEKLVEAVTKMIYYEVGLNMANKQRKTFQRILYQYF